MKLETLIKQFAQDATHTRDAQRRVEHRIRGQLQEHFADPLRRDRRGRKVKSLREAEKTLRHLTRAAVWQDWPHLDLNVRQEAQALVKTACHGQTPFEQLMKRASVLRGRVGESGRVRNACMPIKGCDPLLEGLPHGFTVERLHTVERLAQAGRRLGNCAKNNAYGLHNRLRRRESDFYLMLRDSEPAAMFEVDLEAAKITEFLGKRNADVDLPRPALIALLQRLQLNGDDVEACLQQGAASIFATGTADVREPDWQHGNLAVWLRPRRLLIKEGRKREWWSSFEWNGANWEASDASRRRRLDALVTRYPFIATLAGRALEDTDGDPPTRPVRGRVRRRRRGFRRVRRLGG